MQVVIFEEQDFMWLEKKINEFLEETKNIKVIDMKFTSHPHGCRSMYAVLVMYEEER